MGGLQGVGWRGNTAGGGCSGGRAMVVGGRGEGGNRGWVKGAGVEEWQGRAGDRFQERVAGGQGQGGM